MFAFVLTMRILMIAEKSPAAKESTPLGCAEAYIAEHLCVAIVSFTRHIAMAALWGLGRAAVATPTL
jgi:hypothetical protein